LLYIYIYIYICASSRESENYTRCTLFLSFFSGMSYISNKKHEIFDGSS
jgi:hypothetical protein